jgi:phosphoserine phosphatase
VDIHLRRLKEFVDDATLASLKFEVFTADGRYVYSDREERILHKTIFELARKHSREDWLDFGKKITSGGSGMVKLKGLLSPKRYWIYYTPIPSAGWSFTCRYPEEEVMAGLNERRAITLLGLGAALLLILGCIVYMSGLITRPITELNDKVLEVAEGNLDVHIDEISSEDEIGTLGRSFNKMTDDLRTYVEKVERLTKLQRELEIAREIQKNTLPKEMPPLAGFDIDAWNEPADETGGDTYDVIGYKMASGSNIIEVSETDADQAILLLADATGHGIGPALSVTQLRAMLRMAIHISVDISAIAKHINEQLCADLPPAKFITAWFANVDVRNNTLTYFSAGQGPLLRYSAADEKVAFFDAQSPPLGIMLAYNTKISDPIQMDRGDIFAVISDGIYEAGDNEGELFGNDRVIDVITRHHNGSAREILNALRVAVGKFTKDAPADDDRTIIIIKRV